MIIKKQYSTENPKLQPIYKYLTEEAKAELHRLEEVERQAEMCFSPLDEGIGSKLSYFAYVYTQYVALVESDIDSDLALSISHFQYDLMILESTLRK